MENIISIDEEEFDITQFHSCEDNLYWCGCYASDKTFKKFIHSDTYSHPAKASMILMDKIFKHLKKLKLLKEGDVICDFMAGSGRTNIMASLHGFDSIAIELEPHFIKMINQNKELLEKKTGRKANWEIIQGDSRKMVELLKDKKNLIGITSPPYQNIALQSESNADERRKILSKLMKEGKKVSKRSLSWINNPQQKPIYQIGKYKRYNIDNPSNIGNLPNKKIVGITSPPYEETFNNPTWTKEFIENWEKKHGKRNIMWKELEARYNPDNPNNIGNLSDKKLIGITSPPYEQNTIQGGSRNPKFQQLSSYSTLDVTKSKLSKTGNIGDNNSESYLSAMFQVYQQASQLIPIIVTITKNPTRKGKLKRLDLDTAKLLMACGYEIIDYHRALLFEEKSQATLSGNIKKIQKGRLSFFKRLSIQKGNVASNFEDIIIAVRKK